jgi:hypothetical protein
MRIVGIVLLALLGLVLLLILLVLFVPFTYRVAGSYHAKELRLHGRLFGLAGLLGGGIEAQDGKWMPYLRILGVKWRPGKKKPKGKAKAPEKHPEQAAWERVDGSPMEEVQDAKPAPADSTLADTEPVPMERITGIRKRFTGLIQKCRDIWQKFTGAVRSFRQTSQRVVALVSDEENRQGVRALGGRVFRLLQYLCPRRMKLTLAYSAGSPDTTGQLLGVLALFPFTYRNRWKVTPDFEAEELYVETDFDVRGHIFGIQILYVLVGIVLDQDCQKLYNKFSS